MTDGAHDVGLTALLSNRVFHGFTVNSKAFVVLSVCFILKKSVEFNPAENIQHKLDRPIGGISCI